MLIPLFLDATKWYYLYFPTFLIDTDIFVLQTPKVLNTNASMACFDVDLNRDELIEETEVVMLSLELSDAHGIAEVAPSTTNIIIFDEDCEYNIHSVFDVIISASLWNDLHVLYIPKVRYLPLLLSSCCNWIQSINLCIV